MGWDWSVVVLLQVFGRDGGREDGRVECRCPCLLRVGRRGNDDRSEARRGGHACCCVAGAVWRWRIRGFLQQTCWVESGVRRCLSGLVDAVSCMDRARLSSLEVVRLFVHATSRVRSRPRDMRLAAQAGLGEAATNSDRDSRQHYKPWSLCSNFDTKAEKTMSRGRKIKGKRMSLGVHSPSHPPERKPAQPFPLSTGKVSSSPLVDLPPIPPNHNRRGVRGSACSCEWVWINSIVLYATAACVDECVDRRLNRMQSSRHVYRERPEWTAGR